MADDINLPNLMSHLAVNLDGVSGAVADASRQGSSMGAALGNGIHRQLDDLLRHLPQVTIDGDSDPLDRDLARIHRDLAALDAQRIGVDISVPDALRQLEDLERNLQRIGDAHPNVNVRATTAAAARQLEELRAAARQVDDTDVDIDVDVDEEHVDRANRLTGAFGRLAGMAGSLGGVVGTLGKLAAGLGAAVPAAGAVVSTLANVAPAAGIAVTGLAAVQLASGTVKLAMVGVGDSISAALDPSKSKEFAESLEKLAPSAREFATAVHDMAPDLRALQKDVQQEAFRGLGENLERTAKSVLPVLRTNLLNTATALGDMAGGAMGAARDLADSGTLGKALGSASSGLRNLSGLPATVVTALGQIAAAAGPSFEGLTAAAAHSANLVGEKLSGAFKSGAMQDAIQTAVDLLGDLIDVGSNVGTILGNVFSAVPAGGGLVGTLGAVTTALAEITGTEEVQSGLRALFETMATVGATAAPLLGQALSVIAPVLTALGPPVQLLVTQLGAALRPVIAALGPVLVQAATALGSLATAFAPLLPVVGQLVAALLPALSPLLAGAQQIFVALAPVVKTLAGTLQAALAPILAQLPALIGPLVQIIATSFVSGLTVLQQLLVALAPSLASMGQSFGSLLAALAPLIMAVAQLQARILSGLMPVIQPLIGLVGSLAAILAGVLARYINAIVVPALQVVTALLTGDFSGAWTIAKTAVSNAATFIGQMGTKIGTLIGNGVSTAVNWLKGLPGRAAGALSSLGTSLQVAAATGASRLVSAIAGKVSDAIAKVRELPSRAASALSGLGGLLVKAGASLIQGLIDGIQSKIGAVKSKLSDLTSMLPSWKGPPSKDAKILTPAGRLLITGFIKGIDESTAKLRSRLESITKALPSNVKSGVGKALAKATAELQKEVTKRDAVLKKLDAAQKKLDDLVKARAKAASDITSGILSEANITTGHGDVNSVTAITVGLQQALKASKAFQANIAALKKAGLRSDLLQQIADAGVEGGAATAAALAKATPAELKKINDLQSQLAKSATATGNTVGDALYSAGIQAAKGLVAGLKSQESVIEKLMKKIAEQMLKTVKDVHKTKSPSRAFRDIGVMDMEGWRGGVLANAARVISAARDTARGVLDAASGVGGALATVPTAGQVAGAYGGAGGRGDQNNVINLYGSEASPDGILRALSWQGLVAGG
ncbi:phage tail protein [Streptomyces antibioticus]|uniref:phage tail protein n=1 Tax=Streptomyces antibioticus TaxID=1890 RepID=UPI0033AEC307